MCSDLNSVKVGQPGGNLVNLGKNTVSPPLTRKAPNQCNQLHNKHLGFKQTADIQVSNFINIFPDKAFMKLNQLYL